MEPDVPNNEQRSARESQRERSINKEQQGGQTIEDEGATKTEFEIEALPHNILARGFQITREDLLRRVEASGSPQRILWNEQKKTLGDLSSSMRRDDFTRHRPAAEKEGTERRHMKSKDIPVSDHSTPSALNGLTLARLNSTFSPHGQSLPEALSSLENEIMDLKIQKLDMQQRLDDLENYRLRRGSAMRQVRSFQPPTRLSHSRNPDSPQRSEPGVVRSRELSEMEIENALLRQKLQESSRAFESLEAKYNDSMIDNWSAAASPHWVQEETVIEMFVKLRYHIAAWCDQVSFNAEQCTMDGEALSHLLRKLEIPPEITPTKLMEQASAVAEAIIFRNLVFRVLGLCSENSDGSEMLWVREEHAQTIRSIEKNLRQANVSDDDIAFWRCLSTKGLNPSPVSQSGRLLNIVEVAWDDLVKLFSLNRSEARAQLWEPLVEEILSMAVDLSRSIRMCPTMIWVQYPDSNDAEHITQRRDRSASKSTQATRLSEDEQTSSTVRAEIISQPELRVELRVKDGKQSARVAVKCVRVVLDLN